MVMVKLSELTLAPDQTQPMLITHRQDMNTLPAPEIQLEGRLLLLQGFFSILRVEIDSGLSYTSHAKKVAKKAA